MIFGDSPIAEIDGVRWNSGLTQISNIDSLYILNNATVPVSSSIMALFRFSILGNIAPTPKVFNPIPPIQNNWSKIKP